MNKNELNKSFKVPENYFENLNDEISLKKMMKESNFKIPINYFEELEETILRTTIKEEKRNIFHFNIWWAAACILLLAVALVPFWMNNKEQKQTIVVDSQVENQIYEKIYDSYIAVDQNKKSSNVTLDDSDFVLYDY